MELGKCHLPQSAEGVNDHRDKTKGSAYMLGLCVDGRQILVLLNLLVPGGCSSGSLGRCRDPRGLQRVGNSPVHKLNFIIPRVRDIEVLVLVTGSGERVVLRLRREVGCPRDPSEGVPDVVVQPCPGAYAAQGMVTKHISGHFPAESASTHPGMNRQSQSEPDKDTELRARVPEAGRGFGAAINP